MAEEVTLSPNEVVSELATNPVFAIDFALANQREAIKNNIESILKSQVENTDENLRAILLDWHNNKDPRFLEALNVAYDPAAQNYTGGLGAYFGGNPSQRSAGVWGSVLSGIGAFATSFGTQLTGTGTGSTLTAQQLAELERQRQEEERRKRQTTTIIVVSVLLIAGVVGVVLWQRNKKKGGK